MLHDERVGDSPPADEVFLDDPLEQRRIASRVPGAFGVDDRDRTALADAEAVGLCAQDASLLREAELLQAAFEKLPRREAALFLAALRVRLVAAEQHVPSRDADTDGAGHGAL